VTVTAPESWRVADGTVPLIDVVRTADLSYNSADHAVRTGLVKTQSVGGVGKARRISLEDALMIVAVAALAVAAGIAFNILLRSIKETGGRITSQGLTIPLK
jgi:hypothetical protein